jgi:hypothetical protein
MVRLHIPFEGVSVLTVSQHSPRVRRGIAGLLAVVLATAGLSVLGATVPAFAADAPAITVTEAPAEGGTVTITGSGFAPAVQGDWAPGVYVGVGAAGATNFYSASIVDEKSYWVSTSVENTDARVKMAADGSFSLTLRVPAPTADVPSYAVYTAKAHGQAEADPSQSTVTPVVYVVPPTAPPTTAPPTAPPTTAPPVTPVVAHTAVAPTTGLDPAGATFTATGTGFTAGLPIYLGVAPKSVLDAPGWFGISAYFTATKRVTVGADGTFSQAFSGVKAAFSSNGTPVDCTVVECGVFTFSAVHSGAADRSQDTFTAISFTPVVAPQVAKTVVAPAKNLDPAGATFTATGTGFTAGLPIYLGVAPKSVLDAPGWFNNSNYFAAAKRVTVGADGTFSQAFSAVKAAFSSNGTPVDCTVVECGVFTFSAVHSGAADRSQDTFTPISFSAVVTPPTTAPPTAPPTTPPVDPTTPAGAKVTAAPSVGLDPAGATVTASGTGFTTGGSGIYVAVGPKSALNDPSWFTNAEYFTAVKWLRTINADGSFSQVLTDVKASFASNGTPVDCSVIECGIYTFAAHGSTNRSNDTYTPITFATKSGPTLPPITTPTTPPAPTYTPTPLVLSAASVPNGGTITISGNGFKPNEQIEIVLHSDPILLGTVRADSFGNFTFTTTIPAGAPLGEHTIIATGVESGATTQTAVTIATAQEVCVARVVSGASLDWGVKTSFRNYISGGIAKGSVSVSGLSNSGSSYGWSGGSGSLNPTAVKGLVRYPGSVHFEGHGGVLNLTLSNVAIRVLSSNSAVLIADVASSDMDGKASSASGVEFATLSLGGASVSGSTFRVSDAAASLTSAGAGAFAGFYTAGTALDPVSFTFPLGAETECDQSTTSSLASTGVDGLPATLAGTLLLLVLGAGVLVLARRRNTQSTVS